MNGSEEAGGGGHERQQSSMNAMSNLPTPPHRAKMVHNSRDTIFGYVTKNNDGEERTARDEANDLESIITVLNSEQEFPRPLPSPEPPRPSPRWPWPGTSKKLEPTKHVNGACHETYAVRPRQEVSYLMCGTATVRMHYHVPGKETMPNGKAKENPEAPSAAAPRVAAITKKTLPV